MTCWTIPVHAVYRGDVLVDMLAGVYSVGWRRAVDRVSNTKIFIFLFMIIFAVCNVTITAKDVLTRSGKSFGEIKSSPGMKGPIFCWFRYQLFLFVNPVHIYLALLRFIPSPAQRVELHIYRILRVGRYDSSRER